MNLQKTDIFCDWITIKQTHKTTQPLINDGCTIFVDSDGNENTPSPKFKSLRGLYASNCQIRSDGSTVEIMFNPSRWNRVDNHFGINVDEAKKLANSIVIEQGCSPFSSSNIHYWPSKKRIHTHKKTDYSAKITRLDLTSNVSVGSPINKRAYLLHVQTLEHTRLEKSIIGLNTYFGKYSERKTICLYDKSLQINEKLMAKSHDPIYLEKLSKSIADAGLLRLEVKYQRALESANLSSWDSLTHTKLTELYIKDIHFMTQPINQSDLDELPNSLLSTLLMYMAGYDIKKRLSRHTYFQHRKELKLLGYDISNQNIEAFKPKTKTIYLTVAEIPSWYRMPEKLQEVK